MLDITISISIDDDGENHEFDSIREAKGWMEEQLSEAEDRVSTLEKGIEDLEV